MKRKKILFVVSSLKLGGGAEKSVTMLVKGLKKYYDIEVLTFYDFDNEYPCSVKRHSFNFKYKNSIIIKAFRFLFLFPLKVKRFLKEKKYDLVISNAEDANLVCIIAKKYFHKFKLWTVIRSNIFNKKNPYYKFRKIHKQTDHNIVLNEATKQEFPYKATIISNALDVDSVTHKKNEEIKEKKLFEKKTILMVGRLVEVKNYEFAIDIFNEMKLKDTNLVIIGTGPIEEELKKKAKNNPNIYFLGQKTNVYAYLNKTTIFLLASHYEGMPRVLMEALACGTLSIANDCKYGPRELLEYPLTKKLKRYEKTKYGYVVEYNNKEAMKSAIKDALEKTTRTKQKPDTRYDIKNIAIKWVKQIEGFFE